MNYDNRDTYDVFNAFLLEDADYEGYIELPALKTSEHLPEKVVTFSKAMSASFNDFECWVVFYEHDRAFARLWNNPRKYLNKLKKFKGIISPDFSVYWNMPLVMQMWNVFRGRALAVWMQNNGIEIIPNVRFGDERTFSFCFDGIEKGKTVAIGTHGCIKRKSDKAVFEKGIDCLIKTLTPHSLIIYGAAPDSIFKKYKDMGINLVVFESEFSNSRKRGDA